MIARLKTLIRGYNSAYRVGEPLVPDVVYDTNLSKLKSLLPDDEYEVFISGLFDVGGEVQHDYVIGSLRKCKAEDDSFETWQRKHKSDLLVVEKLDGMSIVLHFIHGKLFKAVTRGDGTTGVDHTSVLKLITPDMSIDYTGQLRGEVLLPKANLDKLNANGYDYKSPRNAVVGIVRSGAGDTYAVGMLEVRIYQVFKGSLSKTEQYDLLIKSGLKVPKFNRFEYGCTKDQLIEMYNTMSDESDYDIDGLVIHDLSCLDENVRYPNDTVAFKINDQVGTTVVNGVEWNISKNGLYIPTVLIDTVVLGCANIQRVAGHNMRYIVDDDIKIGSIVTVCKSGDIIPKIINVNNDGNSMNTVVIPTTCTHCGTTLTTTDVNLLCPNTDCEALGSKKVASFIRSCGVKGYTSTSLESMNINSIYDLLAFTANPRRKKETKLVIELDEHVFNKTKTELVVHLPYSNFGTTLVNNVLEAFSGDIDMILSYNGGNVSVQKVSTERLAVYITQLGTLIPWVNAITSDNRWDPDAVSVEPLRESTKLDGMLFCFTGKFDTVTREDAEAMVWSNSGEVKGVSKKLNYLVNNDIESTSGKNKKAKALGIPIITEVQFLEMLK